MISHDFLRQLMEKRLDAAIDRAVKRLVQAKAMKQMLASPLSTAKLSHQRRFQPQAGPNYRRKTTKAGRWPACSVAAPVRI
jgi:hypothetical protein